MNRGKLMKDARMAAGRFRAERALDSVKAVWSKARRIDSPAVQAAAERIADELRQAGLQQVAVEAIPADGVTAFGGWVMPVAWSVRDAQLKVSGPRIKEPVLVDHAVDPMGLAMYSPATPRGQWVEGPVVVAKDVPSVRRRLQGAFLFLEQGAGSFEVNEAAARAGALGVLVCVSNVTRNASRYLNYSVPPGVDRPCIPCFSLSPAAGERVRALLACGGDVRLRARVRARRAAGTLPLVTATLGPGQPSLYVCAHMDEPGAQDNASGVGTAIEAVRVLRELESVAGLSPARRSVKVFFSTEVRGLQAWVNHEAKGCLFVAGLNLDMVGHAGVPMVLRGGFRDQPHFAGQLLREAASIADSLVKGIPSKTGSNYVSDAILKPCCVPAHVSIEQEVDASYHSSSDVPDLLDPAPLRWAGATAVAFLYAAMRMENGDVLKLAGAVQNARVRESLANPGQAAIIRYRARRELESLRPMMSVPAFYGDRTTPSDLYREGVRRATGCWPEVEQKARLERLIAEEGEAGVPAPVSRTTGRLERMARQEAEQLFPRVLFSGYLSFEDEWPPARAAALNHSVGLSPGWGTEAWAWMLTRHFRGKASLAEVVDQLGQIGVTIEMDKAVRLARHLVRVGKARWMPLLTPSLIRARVKALGLKRGGIVLAHSSLSHFGYIQGGPATVVEVLQDLVGPKGTLVMPTHTNSVLGALPFDRARTPSKVGAVTEYFRTRPGVVRSAHPTHSVAASGPAAADVTGAHKVDMSPMDREGFWGRLVDWDGEVLMLCPIRSATLFHAGEEWTGVPQPLVIAHAIGEDNRRRIHILPHCPWHVDHFEEALAMPLLKQGVMRCESLGEGLIYKAPARAMAGISVQVNRANPLVSLGKGGACTCFYCTTLRRGVLGPVAGRADQNSTKDLV